MSTILPALLVYVPASGCADFDHGILRLKDEERFEDFRDQLRRHVSEGLDAFVIDLFDGGETDAKAVMGQGGIGCTDADLSHLFPAIDKQARLLWERGMRAQWAKERA